MPKTVNRRDALPTEPAAASWHLMLPISLSIGMAQDEYY